MARKQSQGDDEIHNDSREAELQREGNIYRYSGHGQPVSFLCTVRWRAIKLLHLLGRGLPRDSLPYNKRWEERRKETERVVKGKGESEKEIEKRVEKLGG